MSERENEERGVVWAVLIGVVLLAISLAVGMGLYRTSKTAGAADGGQPQQQAEAEMAATGPGLATNGAAPASDAPASTAAMTTGAAAAADDGPAIRVEDGVVKFYFASGSAELAPGAAEALGDVVKGVAAGQTAVVSGYHDTTGDPAQNEELAKQRALAVRDALAALGIGDDKVELKKPEVTSASGSNAEARRVEVSLQ